MVIELISISRSEAGGLKEVIASKRDKYLFNLKYESGVHRVQRVPTPKRGQSSYLQQQLQFYLKRRGRFKIKKPIYESMF